VGDTEELRARLAGIPARTLAAKLRVLMPVIVSRIDAGVRHREILAVLNENGGVGKEVTLRTLQCYLYRYRKAQRGASPRAATPAERERATAVTEVPPPRSTQAAGPLAVTPSMLRQARNKPIDMELLAEIGRSTFKKKGV
jgi:pyruvate/2-oxoglutarate dehydrogenase complex dihydrolipoamide acyltransferase (E2) component